MNQKFLKSAVAFALVCGAPLLQAQVLGGGAGGALGGGLGGSLGGGIGTLGGSGNGSMNGALDGSLGGLAHGDTLRRAGAHAVERTREIVNDAGQRAHEGAARSRDTAQGAATTVGSAAQGINGSASAAGNGAASGAGSIQSTLSDASGAMNGNLAGEALASVDGGSTLASTELPSATTPSATTPSASTSASPGQPSAPALPQLNGDGHGNASGSLTGDLDVDEPQQPAAGASTTAQPAPTSSPIRASANGNGKASADASVSAQRP